jgi:hypothetical protein
MKTLQLIAPYFIVVIALFVTAFAVVRARQNDKLGAMSIDQLEEEGYWRSLETNIFGNPCRNEFFIELDRRNAEKNHESAAIMPSTTQAQ